jgi:UDP-GlcNAc:undecaprenyl-phosphate GlcNAc-1-phosphate transferase
MYKVGDLMNFEINGHNIFEIVLVTFVSSIILVPIMRKVAIHVNAMDEPNARRLNKIAMPTLGGLAIFFSFMLGYMLYANQSLQMLSILMGSFILVLMGLIDDISPIKAKYQLVAQLIAAGIIVFYGKITLDYISVFGINLNFGVPWNYIITIVIIVGVINAINLSDGLDGLCSGVSSIYFFTIAVIAFIMNAKEGLDTTLALVMLGSTLGFLVYNFPPAQIYLGDTGSNLLGFIIAVIALLGYKTATFTSLIIPLIILATPIIDVIFSIIRRILKGQNPFNTPDKQHLHHQLLKMQFSTRASLLIIYAIDILFAAVSILYALGDTNYAILIYVGLMIIFLFIVLKTDILFPKK